MRGSRSNALQDRGNKKREKEYKKLLTKLDKIIKDILVVREERFEKLIEKLVKIHNEIKSINHNDSTSNKEKNKKT